MARRGQPLALLLVLLPVALRCAPQVMYVETAGKGFIGTAQTKPVSLSGEGLGASLAALLSTEPAFAISSHTSRQVESTVAGDVFHRPDAVVALQVAGLELGDEVKSKLSALGSSASLNFGELAQRAINAVSGVTRCGGVQHVPLDHRALPGCNDECAEDLLKAAAPVWAANYTREDAGAPATGTLSLPSAQGEAAAPVVLDLTDLNARLWAVELANLQHMAAKHAEAASSNEDNTAALLESTLLGLQGLRASYSPESEEFKAAVAATLKTISSAVSSLRDAYGDRLVLQLCALGHVPLDTLQELMAWRDTNTRRTLLARALEEEEEGDSDEGEMSAGEWATWAVQLLVALLLLVAALGAVYTMVYMKFKQDSLLYSKPKTD